MNATQPPAHPALARHGAGVAADGEFRMPTHVFFGRGVASQAGRRAAGFGADVVMLVSDPGVVAAGLAGPVRDSLAAAGLDPLVFTSVEPNPRDTDCLAGAERAREAGVGALVAVGGGSSIDTAKCIALLVTNGGHPRDWEDFGALGSPPLPVLAIPTTAGTGSEATKNAVISERAPSGVGVASGVAAESSVGAASSGGFKKSFRDESLVARVAIVDPDLLATCPPELIAADGLDALTQLLESYLSMRANPFTDALALSGLACVREGLAAWFDEAVAGRGAAGPRSVAAIARERMAYAALCSGICLAQAGLGAVHGLASPLGAQYPIPHGVACGATLAAATRVNIAALESRDPHSVALARYAAAGWILTGRPGTDDREARSFLVPALERLVAHLGVPRLSSYGITEASIAALVTDSRGSSMKTNPIVLTDDEIAAILRTSL